MSQSPTLQSIQTEALHFLNLYYEPNSKDGPNPVPKQEIAKMIKDKASLKVIWCSWYPGRWQEMLNSIVGGLVMSQLFANHKGKISEIMADGSGSPQSPGDSKDNCNDNASVTTGMAGYEQEGANNLLKSSMWIDVDLNDKAPFEFDECFYRVMLNGLGGGPGGQPVYEWVYATRVSKSTLDIRLLDEYFFCIDQQNKHHLGACGMGKAYQDKVFKMQKYRW